jgi:DNA-binding NarL/FixJ family response regulator
MNTMPESGAAPIRVLLVDDHKTLLWGLQRLIESAQPRMLVVGVARSADEMLTQAEQLEFDVVLLDLDLAGHNVADDLPELARRTSAHVLVLTAERDPDVHEAAVLQGARGVLRKDEAPDVILRAIERVHAGEVWINRNMMGRVLGMMTSQQRSPARDPEDERIATLTAREREVIAAVVSQRGAKGVAIAEELNISESTLRNHLTVIYDKLGLHNRIELFVYAGEHDLVDRGASRPVDRRLS